MSYGDDGSSCPVVDQQYCAPFPVELTISKNAASLSGDSYHICDPDGNVLFKMDGHAFSVRDKCVLLDPQGGPVLCAHKKLISTHHRWEVFSGDQYENKLFYLRKAKVIQFKTHLDVVLTGNDNDDCPDYTIKGNFGEREGQILRGDVVIAEMKRKYSVGNVLLDKHTFITAVSPGTDQAFIAALVVIMDDIHRD
uniref:LURP-one-related 15 protein n=1 Tax=Hymenophyllum caudiculatum TaxID=295381 RepID=A0A2P1JJ67_9MONI|nr:LURP-one-related 15 protein [Hymenophyllum caudiculatum]